MPCRPACGCLDERVAIVRTINLLLALIIVVTGSILVITGAESGVRWVGAAMAVAGIMWLVLHFARPRRSLE